MIHCRRVEGRELLLGLLFRNPNQLTQLIFVLGYSVVLFDGSVPCAGCQYFLDVSVADSVAVEYYLGEFGIR